jgi:hypothetical protein
MLADCARIQGQDTKWLNKRRAKRGEPDLETLYTEQEAEECVRQFVTIGYDRSIQIADGVTLTFIDAGHILGSAIVEIRVTERGRTRTLVFSGDLGQPGRPIVRDPTPIAKADVPAERRDWLRARTDDAAGLCHRVAADTVRVGALLLDVKRHLPHGTFLRWLAALTAFSRATPAPSRLASAPRSSMRCTSSRPPATAPRTSDATVCTSGRWCIADMTCDTPKSRRCDCHKRRWTHSWRVAPLSAATSMRSASSHRTRGR